MSQPGYLIPDNPQPDGFYCLKVFIPADDLYLYAFGGAFQFFGKWLAWERDSSHKGALAAAAWQEAISKTFLEGWLNCGEDDVCEHCDLIPIILEQLQELNNMNVNVNCGSGSGGCGCGCQTAPPIPEPPTTETPPYENPAPLPTPEDTDGLTWKCNMSHYLVYSYRYMMIQMMSPGTFPDWSAMYNGLFSGFTTAALSFSWYVYTLLVYLLNGQSTDDVTVPIDEAYDQLVCAIYSASTDVQASENFSAIITQIFPQSILRQAALAMVSQTPFVAAFEVQPLENLPITHNNRDCSACGTPTTFPPPPETEGFLYTFECPASITQTVASEFTTDYAVDPGGCWIEYAASWPGNGNTWLPEFDIVSAGIPGRELIGLAVNLASLTTVGGNDPADGRVQIRPPSGYTHVSMLQGEIHGWINEDYAADFSGWPGTVHELDPLDLGLNAICEFYRRSGVGAAAGTLSLRMLVRFIYREPL